MNIIILGAPASGKMTIGQELEKVSLATLFHNHESIDFVLHFLPEISDEMMQLATRIRLNFYYSFAKLAKPIIGTEVIDFKQEGYLTYLDEIQNMFQRNHQDVVFVELETSLEERLKRNKTENRLRFKPIKRNTEVSEKEIIETAKVMQFVSKQAPESLNYYLKINNTELSAKEVANQIMTFVASVTE
ncbi:DEAD/DEAH box helicase family protein [Streptococcus iniae]|uniref:AAA family ATPase n=1 Tax=Streptococcus iniae TaxID=1346 RepID=UPI002B312F7C|nr:shikimate kinase [Streptococcus iniae]WNZ90317.1 shikimate kinase [Streptococcus iniae]WNZ96358.1 shikimate kinase [Streptococcus iniae]